MSKNLTVKDKNVCAVCGSSRQRNLIFTYVKAGKRIGSFSRLPLLKIDKILCIRCVLFSYERYREQWFNKHLKAWVMPMSRYLDMSQKIAVNDFRDNHEKDFIFSLDQYL